MARKPLTPKQERFVAEYLANGRNAAAAYRAAYDAARMSDQSVEKEAKKLLRHPLVAPRIAEVCAKAEAATEVTAARVLQELGLLALSDIGQVLDFSGTEPRLRPAAEIPEAARRAIASLKVKRHTEGSGDNAREVEVTEFKLWDKLSALEKLARHLGMFVERHEHSGTVELEIVERLAVRPASGAGPAGGAAPPHADGGAAPGPA